MNRGLLGGLAVLVAIQLVVLLYHFGVTLAFPYDLNYGEGYVLNDAVRLARGESLYVDLQQFPMVRSPYPPLFPAVWSALLPVTGVAFLGGRLLSMLSLVGVVAVVGWNALRVRCGIWPAVAACGFVIASPFVYGWAGYARVDLLALFLAVGGVVVAQWVGGTRGALLAAVLCALAIWTKQTTVTAAVAITIAYTLRDWRRALVFVATLGIPSAVVLAILNAATGGEFVRHVITGNAASPNNPIRAAVYVGTFAVLDLPALIAGVWWLRRALGRAPSPIAVYLPVALLAAFSAGNGGSSINYLLEPVFALALVFPFAWRAVPQSSAVAAPFIAVLQLALLLHFPNGFGTGFLAESAIGHTPVAADFAVGAHLDEVVRAAPGAVIAEPAGFALRNGRPVYLQPIDLRAEQLLGRWRPEPLVQALSNGRFPLILTAYNLFPTDAETAIATHYALAETVPSPDGVTYRVYRYER